MPILKAQLHTHTRQDPKDNIKYTETQLIDHATHLGYNVLAITCNNVVIHNDQLASYAKQKGILLIPGIEKEIEKKRVLILNATIKAQNINTFEDLRKYKDEHPDCLTIASHPFHWSSYSLKKKLIEHIDLFDAIEDNYYRSEKFNTWNHKAHKVAEEYNLPIVGTSDTHILKYMDSTYSIIDAEKKDIKSIFKAIKNHKVETVSQNLKPHNLLTIPMNIMVKNIIRKTLLLP